MSSFQMVIWNVMLISVLYCTSVWGAGISMDGETEVRWKLQQTSSSDRETCGSLRHFSQNRPAYGFPQWVLCAPEAAGTRHAIISAYNVLEYVMEVSQSILKCLAGLLCGYTLSHWDGHSGAEDPADPVVVPKSDLPPGLCAEGPGPDESQVCVS